MALWIVGLICLAVGVSAGWSLAHWRLRTAIEDARRDALTGLWNRKAFEEQLGVQGAIAARYEVPLSVVLIDVDRLKEINDTLGHIAGDAALIGLANRLRDTSRRADIVARYGGDEFVLLLPQTDTAGATVLAERLRAGIEAGTAANPQANGLTISAGIATLAAGEDPQQLIARADTALYQSKHTGRNRVTLAEN